MAPNQTTTQQIKQTINKQQHIFFFVNYKSLVISQLSIFSNQDLELGVWCKF